MLISVIVTTYNRPDYLSAVLRSLFHQTDRNFEIIVADDGSGPETQTVIRQHQGVRHVWHEHNGFRAAEIRNRAIVAAKGDYLIFSDGDCIMPSRFVATHRRLAERDWFVPGKRVFLSRSFTERVLRDDLQPEQFGLAQWIRRRANGDVSRFGILASLPLGPLRKLSPNKWKSAQTCNLGVWRSDIERVGGFDVRYVGWGLEDSDFVVRLLRSGVQRKSGRFACAVIHLWHPQESKHTPANTALFKAMLEQNAQ